MVDDYDDEHTVLMPSTPMAPGGSAHAAQVTEAASTATSLAGGLRSGTSAAQTVQGAASNVGSMARGAQALAGGSAAVRDVAGAVGTVASVAAGSVALLQEAEGLVRGIVEGARRTLPLVHYDFVAAEAGDAHWRLVRWELTEGLSESYRGTIDLATDTPGANRRQLLGASFELTLGREAVDNVSRRVCGIIHRVERLPSSSGHQVARVHIGPALLALRHQVNSRIFQHKTVQEIVSAVLEAGLAPHRRECQWRLDGSYPSHEYCVQYRESDFDFVSRLLEEAGIAYHFDHTGEREVIVFTDTNAPFRPVDTMDGHAVRLHEHADHGLAEAETVHAFEPYDQLGTTSVVSIDYDWSLTTPVLTRSAAGSDTRGHEREELVYADTTISGYEEPTYRHDDGQRQVDIRQEEHASQAARATGVGNVIGLRPGVTFELDVTEEDDPTNPIAGRYLVTRVVHEGYAPDQLPHASAEEHARVRYQNRFECLPRATTFRPARRTPRPPVRGIQTARVVGPMDASATGDVYTDRHGRVKVEFHWDREGALDEHSSCWLRVAQAWAGSGFGAVALPRIGMEVIVQFIEHDPDRPLITGCVYNGNNPPPHLPEHPRRSTFRTQSQPTNNLEGYNELFVDDEAGAELISLRAQKDLREHVLHDHATHVGSDQSNVVDHDQTEEVKRDQAITVRRNRRKDVKGDESSVIEGPNGRTEVVTKHESLTIGGNRVEDVSGNETVAIHGTRTETIDQCVTETMHNDRVVHIDGNDRLVIDHDRTEVTHGSSDVITEVRHQIQQGSTTMKFEGGNLTATVDGTVRIERGSASISIARNNDMRVQSTGKITLHTSGAELELNNASVQVSATEQIVLTVGGSTLILNAEGVSLSGAKVTSAASGQNEITGATVKIN